MVTDTREVSRDSRHRLTGLSARLYALCDVATTVPALLRQPSITASELEVRTALDNLLAAALMACDDVHYLSLAVFRNRPAEPARHRANAYLNISETPATQPLLRVV